MAQIESLMRSGESRLLTLTGPGGVGKSRLAIEVADNVTECFLDGAAFVPLAPVDDPALVVPTIAQRIGLPRSGRPPMEALLSHLRDAKMLIMLDNLEQVLEASPEVAELIGSCPRLSVLATSRAPLRIRGEREYPLQPLETPKPDRELSLRDVTGNPAVEMFVDRARDAAPNFRLTQMNATAVVAICRRLDGLPLAIELCAARLRSLTPKELLSRLDRSLPLLTGGARDLPERQRTMRSAIEWSYRLLTEPERRLLNRLSVFRGGWDLDAAEAVGTVEDDMEEVLDGLSSLVEQSLVVAEKREGGNSRYRLLVPVHEYAEEQLDRNGEANEARRRHAIYVLELAERAEPELTGPSQLEWLARLDQENDNLRAALAWSVDHAKEIAMRLAPALWRYWEVRGNFTEVRQWLEAALVFGEEADPSVRAKLLSAVGWMAYWQGDDDRAVELASDNLRLCRAMGDGARIAAALQQLGLTLMRGDPERGIPMLEESVALGRGMGGGRGVSLPLLTLGSALLERRDTCRARPLLEEGLAISREAGDTLAIGRLL
jgi:predicted ATPase